MRRVISLIALALLSTSCAAPPPKIQALLLPHPQSVIAYDLDRGAGSLPSVEELASAISTPVDSAQFYELITSAEPQGRTVLWLGGFLIVVTDSNIHREFYRISYYGGFFKKIGQSGWYEVPDHQRPEWERFVLQPGALGRIIEQRLERNSGGGTTESQHPQ